MITSAHLVNFMSYRDAWIQFGPMTVIVGANESGKSNLRRALEWCLLNRGSFNDDPAKDAIRYRPPSGELPPFVEVTVTFNDGTSVRRYRDTAGANLYTLRTSLGETIEIGGEGSSVGLGELDDVLDVCKVGVIQFSDGTKAALQFSNDQQEGLFLLGDGMEAIDRKLGVVMGIETLEAATKQAAKQATSAGRSLTAERRRVGDLEGSLARYDGLDGCVQALDVLRALVDERDQATIAAGTAANTTKLLAESRSRLLPMGVIEALDNGWQAVYDAQASWGTSANDARVAEAAGETYLGWRKRTVVTPEQTQALGDILAAVEQKHQEAVLAQEAEKHVRAHYATMYGAQVTVTSLGAQVTAAQAELDEMVAGQVICPITGEIEERCGAREKQA